MPVELMVRGPRSAPMASPAGVSRLWAGGLLALAGLVCWAISLAVFEPAVHSAADLIDVLTWSSENKRPPADEVAQLMLWAKDLRWAGIVLAIGGVLIAVPARAVLVLMVPPWLAVDLYVDRANVAGWPAFAALTIIVGLVLAAIGWAAQRHRREHQGRGGSRAVLIYCGVASAMAPMMLYADPFTEPFRPQGMVAVAAVLSVGLALSAVLAALTAVPVDVANQRTPAGLLFALATIVPTLVYLWWSAEQTAPTIELLAMTWVIAAVLLTGCACLVAGRPSTTAAWIGRGSLAVVMSAVCVAVIWFGVVVSLLLQHDIVALTGDRPHYDGYQYAVAALIAGPIIGLLAVPLTWRSRAKAAAMQ